MTDLRLKSSSFTSIRDKKLRQQQQMSLEKQKLRQAGPHAATIILPPGAAAGAYDASRCLQAFAHVKGKAKRR